MNQPQGSSTPSGRRIVLLGPQRLAPKVGFVARRLGIEGRAALVTAGWQERELETDDPVAALGLPHITAGMTLPTPILGSSRRIVRAKTNSARSKSSTT
jgi:hypothetical protein